MTRTDSNGARTLRAQRWWMAACFILMAGMVLVGCTSTSGAGKADSDNGGASSLADSLDAPVDATIAVAENYEQVQQYLAAYEEQLQSTNATSGTGDIMLLESATTSDSSSGGSAGATSKDAGSTVYSGGTPDASSAASPSSAAGGYSDTNVRTEGVDEADIVKTDGTYIYALQENATEIAVVDTTSDTMKKVGTIQASNKGQIAEFYVHDGRAYVLSNATLAADDSQDSDFSVSAGTQMQLDTFDLSDVASPRSLGTVTQSGYYDSSRFVGDYLYAFSTFYAPYDTDGADPALYVPSVSGKTMTCDDIYLPPIACANQYLVVTSVNVNDPVRVVDQKAVLTDSSSLYVSAENIYVYENRWNVMVARDGAEVDPGRIAIRKISYHDGQLEGVAQTKVQGTLNDSFSIDEYEGMLRLVTTIESWDESARATTSTNSVYVLDENLETKGTIEGLAEDERVYSARFFGDTAYFVTFRQTDPLFTVDFSDPANPRIVGSLKIPGFSEYLHPYAEGKLLGIGMDADEDSGVTSGMKVTMFDVSDPTDVQEADTYLVKGAYYSDVFSDYRAVLISADRNIIGFSGYANQEMYYVLGYDDAGGFTELMVEDVNGNSWVGTRGVYVDDTLYVVKGNAVESYRIGTYEKIDDLLL